MTVHIAIARSNEAVLFSEANYQHPVQNPNQFHKQFVGENFLVGAAGLANVIVAAF